MKDKHITNLSTKLRNAKIIFWLFFGVFQTLILYNNLVRETYTLALLQSLPLLVLSPGLFKGYYRSFSWFCFFLLLYFIWAVEGVFRSDANWLNYSYLFLVCALFVSAILCGRYYQRILKGNPPPAVGTDTLKVKNS